jgi:hypothetical protein
MLEKRDAALMVGIGGIVVEPFMQGWARSEDSEQQDQCNATAGQ